MISFNLAPADEYRLASNNHLAVPRAAAVLWHLSRALHVCRQVAAIPFRWPAFLRSGSNAAQPFYASHLRVAVEVGQQKASPLPAGDAATGARPPMLDGAEFALGFRIRGRSRK